MGWGCDRSKPSKRRFIQKKRIPSVSKYDKRLNIICLFKGKKEKRMINQDNFTQNNTFKKMLLNQKK